MVHRTPEVRRAVANSRQQGTSLVSHTEQSVDSLTTNRRLTRKRGHIEGEEPHGSVSSTSGPNRAFAQGSDRHLRPGQRGFPVFVAPFPLLPMPPQERQTHQGQSGVH